jgi:hypothetical protein
LDQLIDREEKFLSNKCFLMEFVTVSTSGNSGIL